MKLKTLFPLLLILALTAAMQLSAQTLTQTVRGQVMDQDTKMPLAGATVTVVDSAIIGGALTDEEGYFRIADIPVGRHSVRVMFPGYDLAQRTQVMVTSGKELVLQFELQEKLVKMDDVVISASEINKNKPLNEMATVSARAFSVEETKRYAAAISDPARMAQNFAGVMSSGDDMSNDIVIRGNSPRSILWRLEGIEIPNPNHFGSMGASGGPISMLSSSTLGNSDFYTGAFPSEFGNVLSGAFDLQLRKGNNEKREHSFMIGGLGIEASSEGYFSKNSRASYLVNYRYSTLALMGRFIPALDGVVPTYQDVSFNVYLPTKKMGTFTLFGLGGQNNAIEPAEADSSLWESEWDATAYQSGSWVGVAGLTHRLAIGEKTYIKTVIAASADRYQDESYRYLAEQNYDKDVWDVTTFDNYALRLHSSVNHKFNPRHTLRVGVLANHLDFRYKYDNKDWWDTNTWTTYLDNKGSTQILQGYAQWKYRLGENWTLNSGVHTTLLTLNNTASVDPRAAISWQAHPKHKITLASGLYSKPEHVSTYFVEHTGLNGTRSFPNKNLPHTRSLHVVAGHDFQIAKDLRLKTEAYYQHLFQVPEEANDSSYWSILNARDIWSVIDVSEMRADGTARNMGLDVTLEKFFSHSYYFLLTGSLFDSRYTAPNGQVYSTRFNNNYTLSALGGKEFKVGKKQKNVLGLNAKVLWSGGNRYTPIDFDQSQLLGEQVRILDRTNELRTEDYFRADVGVSFAINAKRATHTIMLDVQNVSNRQNVFTQYYDSDSNSLEKSLMNGLFPIFNYRIEF